VEQQRMTTSIPRPTAKFAKKFNTLQLLRYGWYATWATSLLLLVISIFGVTQQRQAIKTVGKDAAPSIITAQQLRDSFADIDASLANELLLKPGEDREALANFEINRKKIADRLVDAAKNITYPDEEKIVKSLQLNGSGYFLKLQEARDAHRRNDPIGALNIYRSAASLVDRDILPKAEELNRVNSTELQNSYDRNSVTNGGIAVLIALIGLVQIGLLVWIQLFLYKRMRRVLNLPLVGASAISIVFLGYVLTALVGAASDLRVAKEDAFESIYALRQARALSYMANADESRYLLDSANAKLHENAFKTKLAKIVTLPPGQSLANVIQRIPQTDGDLQFQLTGFTGLYATQLQNITFKGELAATIEMLKALDRYLQIDAQIRQLYQSGKIAEAIALCTGNREGQSNWAFDRYRKTNQTLREINEAVFKAKIENGNNRLNYFEIIAPIALGGVAVLTLFGLRPRLAEYL
jgi:hypothetical protein